MKKGLIFLFIVLFLTCNVLAANNLKVEKTPISDVVVKEFSQPAKFNFSITNLGSSDNFEIYTLIGIDITPRGTFNLNSGETKSFEVDAYIPNSLRRNLGFLTFDYQIKAQTENILFSDTIKVNIVEFKEVFELNVEDIALSDKEANITLENVKGANLESFDVFFNSVFFSYSAKDVSISPFKSASFLIPINKDVSSLLAGKYLATAEVTLDNITEEFTGDINYVEKKDIKSSESIFGFLISEKVVEKANDGNIRTLETIEVKKNIISRLFTSFSVSPDKTERKGLSVVYSWDREIIPGETFTVKVRTNWTLPFIVLIILIILFLGFNFYMKKDVEVKKRAVFVKTKGGEFAFKIIVSVKARTFAENVSVTDRVPNLVKLHERYQTLTPDRYDEKTKRMEWNLGSMNAGELRVFSYVVYSPVGVVGRFNIPKARLVYEKAGRVVEAYSNEVVFLSEQTKGE